MRFYAFIAIDLNVLLIINLSTCIYNVIENSKIIFYGQILYLFCFSIYMISMRAINIIYIQSKIY